MVSLLLFLSWLIFFIVKLINNSKRRALEKKAVSMFSDDFNS